MKYLLFALVLCTTTLVNAQNYTHYYGNIHAHTSYSDGNKDSATSLMTTPYQAFVYAKASQHIDFYGISEHNHYTSVQMTPANYHKGRADAQAATTNGVFVALYGMEFGVISNGGHVLIYGYDSLISWIPNNYDVFVAQNDYANLWKKISKKAGAFAYLAHPQASDYSNFFTTYTPLADSCVVGGALRSGPAFSTNTTYTDNSTSTYATRYHAALAQGYHLGAGLDHDTHNSVFGRSQAGRLVIMATELTQPALLEAMRKMRFYASDDWNTKVEYTINSQPMGSIIEQAANPTLSATITDTDAGDNVAKIEVYSGVPGSGITPTIVKTVTTATLNYTPVVANNSTTYYYLRITQTDGNVIWTSPIWYTKNTAVTNTPPVAGYTDTTTNKCEAQPITFIDSSSNSPTTWSWIASGATPNFSTAANPVFIYNTQGSYTITLTASNATGSSLPTTSTVIINNCVTATGKLTANDIALYPNPTTNNCTLNLSALAGATSLMIYNPTGALINQCTTWATNYTITTSELSNGLYCIKITTQDGTVIIKKMVVQK